MFLFFIKKKYKTQNTKMYHSCPPDRERLVGWLYNRFDFVRGIFQYYVFLASHGKYTTYIIHEI